MLVVITFLSLSVCHVNGASIRSSSCRRGSRRARARCLALDLRAAGACRLRHASLWQFVGLERSSWRFGDHAPTYPGNAALAAATRRWRSAWRRCASRCCGRWLADIRRLRHLEVAERGRDGVLNCSYLVVTLLFLGLLTAGMAVPFAITIPAVIYLLLQGGFPALNSLGLVSWGSMNAFALTAVPLFMFMAEILSASGLSNRIYGGLAKLVAQLPGRPAADQHRGLRDVCLGQRLEHRHRGIDRRRRAAAAARAATTIGALAAGSLAAGGTLGILIPPSFPMIIYGTFTETSVPKLFMAGVIPGLIMTALLHALHRRACQDRPDGGAARSRARAPGASCCARWPRSCRSSLLILRHAGRALLRRRHHHRGCGRSAASCRSCSASPWAS